MPFTQDALTHPHGAVFHISGRFLSEQEEDTLVPAVTKSIGNGVHKFVFNLEKVEYLNSAGISIFVRLVSTVSAAGGKLVFAAVPERIRTLLDVMKLNAVFEIAADEAAARGQLDL